jgi:RNA polymerase sigma factor (sigma-70 family)
MANRMVRKPTPSENEANVQARILSDFIQDNAAILVRTLRVFVFKSGLAKGEAVREIADEVLQETAIEALNAAHRFDNSRQPRAWLLGIAVNIIKRKRSLGAIKHRNEVAVHDVPLRNENIHVSSHQSESDLFDHLAAIARNKVAESSSSLLPLNDLARDYEANNAAEAMLARCSNEDQTILRLAILEELDGDAVALRLGVPPGTARVRLHRAIKRLRNSLEGEGLHP